MFLELLWTVLGRLVFFTGSILGKSSFPKPLPKEEEDRYLELAMQGDEKAKEVLVKHNMRLVAHIAKKYVGAAETDDLISVGSIGLIKAINTYKPGRGTTLGRPWLPTPGKGRAGQRRAEAPFYTGVPGKAR